MGLPSILVKVWPSSSPRWRWPSSRWPSTSWKKTAEARPLRIAGPLKGSVTGATRSASRFFAISMAFSATVFWSGRRAADSASKVSISEEIHAVGGACSRNNDQPRHMAGRGHARALGGDEVVGLVGRLKLDLVGKYVGKLREELGDFAQALLPRSAIDDQRRRRGKQVRLWLFHAEVGRGVFLFGAHLLLGLDLEVAVERAGIAAIGGVPERARDGVAVVGQAAAAKWSARCCGGRRGCCLRPGCPAAPARRPNGRRLWLELVIAPYSAAMLTDVASSTA